MKACKPFPSSAKQSMVKPTSTSIGSPIGVPSQTAVGRVGLPSNSCSVIVPIKTLQIVFAGFPGELATAVNTPLTPVKLIGLQYRVVPPPPGVSEKQPQKSIPLIVTSMLSPKVPQQLQQQGSTMLPVGTAASCPLIVGQCSSLERPAWSHRTG